MSSKPSTAPRSSTAPRPTGSNDAGSQSCAIVGYDGSEEARHAAVWAARHMAPDGRLVLVHAYRPHHRWPSTSALQTSEELTAHGRALIEELLMDANGALLDLDLEIEVEDDDPAHALIASAQQHGAGEIVLGAHHSTRADSFFGDVVAELVKTAPIPVCIVPLVAPVE
jgi:nucleotide-binding universal stress UspA family protein